MNQFQSFTEVRAALKRRFWVILFVAFAGCLLSLNFAMGQARTYEATAVVQIEDSRMPDQVTGAGAQAEDAARRVQLIEQRLMSRDNLVRIMEKYSLFSADPSVLMNERVSNMREAARITQIRNQANAYAPGGNVPSGLLITVQLDDPQKAADVANELMYSVIEQSRDRSSNRARETLDFFAAEEARVSAEIEGLAEQISAFKRDNGDQLPSGMMDMRSRLAGLRDQDLVLDRQILTIQTGSDRQREEVTTRQVDLLQEQKLLISERIAQIEAQLSGAPEVERELNRLERQLTQLQEQYTVVTRRKAEAEMGQLLDDRNATDRFEVLETALVPEYTISRSRKSTAIVGGVVSVVAGIALAFVIELMNPAIRSAAQMERVLGVLPVVAIPTVRSRRDSRRRGLGVIASTGAAVLMLYVATRYLLERMPALSEAVDRLLPRVVRG